MLQQDLDQYGITTHGFLKRKTLPNLQKNGFQKKSAYYKLQKMTFKFDFMRSNLLKDKLQSQLENKSRSSFTILKLKFILMLNLSMMLP
jgi:hypothetical protein